jgi:hypothetical protein
VNVLQEINSELTAALGKVRDFDELTQQYAACVEERNRARVQLEAATAERDSALTANVGLTAKITELGEALSTCEARVKDLERQLEEATAPPTEPVPEPQPTPTPPPPPEPEPAPAAPFLFSDNFATLPDTGRYVVAAPSGLNLYSVGGNVLTVRVKSDQPHDGNNRRRTEFRERDTTQSKQIPRREKFRTVCWYSAWLQIVKADFPLSDMKFLPFQWHASADKSLGEPDTSPPLSAEIRNGRVKFVQRSSDVKILTTSPPAVDIIEGPTNGVGAPIPLTDLYDKWGHFLVRAVWDWRTPGKDYGDGLAAAGDLKIWFNGALLWDKAGPNCYRDELGPYFNFGLYAPPFALAEDPAPGQSRTVKVRDLRIGGPESKLEDFLG